MSETEYFWTVVFISSPLALGLALLMEKWSRWGLWRWAALAGLAGLVDLGTTIGWARAIGIPFDSFEANPNIALLFPIAILALSLIAALGASGPPTFYRFTRVGLIACAIRSAFFCLHNAAGSLLLLRMAGRI